MAKNWWDEDPVADQDNWWDADPVAEAPVADGQDNWWDADPVAEVEPAVDTERTFSQKAADTLSGLISGSVAVPQSIVGLVDVLNTPQRSLAKLLGADEGSFYRTTLTEHLADVGIDFARARELLAKDYKSEEFQEQRKQVDEAFSDEGLLAGLTSISENPGVAVDTVVESLPAMASIAGVTRLAALKIFGSAHRAAVASGASPAAALEAGKQAVAASVPKLMKISAITEGAQSAGQMGGEWAAEGRLNEKEALAAIGAGVTTAAVSGLANRFLPDVETAIATRELGEGSGKGVIRQGMKNIGLGALREGPIEEGPQSVGETFFQNVGEGNPLGEGLGRAYVEGSIAGTLMGAVGGGAATSPRRQGPEETPPGPEIDAPTGAPPADGAPPTDGGTTWKSPDGIDYPVTVVQENVDMEEGSEPTSKVLYNGVEMLVPQSQLSGAGVGPAGTVSFTPEGSPTREAGFDPIVVPEAGDVRDRSSAGGTSAGRGELPGVDLGRGLGASGLDAGGGIDLGGGAGGIGAGRAAPVSVPDTTGELTSGLEDVRGPQLEEDVFEFSPESGTLGVPRAEMPQVKAEHRGALTGFLKARGITGTEETVPAASLTPTQREFSESKVRKAKDFTGGDRAILVSSDGHVVDGHHQWLARRSEGEDVRVIRLDADINTVLEQVKEFPSSTFATSEVLKSETAKVPDAEAEIYRAEAKAARDDVRQMLRTPSERDPDFPAFEIQDPSAELETSVRQLGAALGSALGFEDNRVFAFSSPGADAPSGFELGGRAFINVQNPEAHAGETSLHEMKHVIERIAEAETELGRTDTAAQNFVARMDELFEGMTEEGKRNYVSNYLFADQLTGLAPEARESRIQELLQDPELRSEMTADFMGKRATDKAWLKDLAEKDPGGFAQFVRKWIDLLDKLIATLKGAKPAGTEREKIDTYVEDLQKAKDIARDALIEYRQAKSDAPAETGKTGSPAFSRAQRTEGRGFTGFFTNITEGLKGAPNGEPFTPVLDTAPVAKFVEEYEKHRGNFDDHIGASIPTFRELQTYVGNAIVESYEDADVLDIGASEGALAKTVTKLSEGGVRTVAVDPAPAMAKHFVEGDPVKGARYEVAAFGTAEQEGQVAWTEDDILTDRDGETRPNPYAGRAIPYYKPDRRFDIVHEAMTFQFVDGNRVQQVARIKQLMKPDGVVILEEKFIPGEGLSKEQFDQNEAQKDEFKEQYFTKEQIQAKAAAVGVKDKEAYQQAQREEEEQVVGMADLMVAPGTLEGVLEDNFNHVVQFWDAGNFKGYMASDSRENLGKLLGNLENVNSEFSTVKTPRWVTEEGGKDGDRTRRDSGRKIAPLEGAPTIEGATGPDPRLVDVAETYAKRAGIDLKRQGEYVEVNEDRARRIADAYEAMEHAPQDPAVKKAYDDLIRQTRDQYDALVKAGYEFTFFDSETDPYAGNPWNAMRDLRKNQKMAVYGTYDGYGTEGITQGAVADNPMLEGTGLEWPDQNGVLHPVTANDLFRAVHDAFGHGLEGAGFRARGEENAWQAHARMFTGAAVGAITSETRGQNSWLNHGPYGEQNRTAKMEDTVFADQKVGLMPEWTWTEGRADEQAPRFSKKQKFKPDPEALEAYLKEKGGATLNADGSFYEPGYGFSVGLLSENHEVDTDAATVATDFANRHEDLLQYPAAKIGLFRMEDGARLALDVALVTSDMDTALDLGRQNDQESIWDFSQLDTLDTGGGGISEFTREQARDLLSRESLKITDVPTPLVEAGSLESATELARSKKFGAMVELKRALQDNIRKVAEKHGVNLQDYGYETQAYVTSVALKDAVDSLQSNSNAVGWYDRNVTDALSVLGAVHPELNGDPDARFVFIYALSVTSNGLKVNKNAELAEKAYQSYKQTGRMPENIGAGQAAGAINGSMKAFNYLKNLHGLQSLREMMGREMEVREVNDLFESKVSGEHLGTRVLGAAFLGPKIGNGFFANLNGDFTRLTMDRWLMRSYGRWTGTLLDVDPKKVRAGTDRLKRAIREVKKTPAVAKEIEKAIGRKLKVSDLMGTAKALAKGSADRGVRGIMDSTPVGEELRKAGNYLPKVSEGQKESPKNGAERNFIREVFAGTLDQIRAAGNPDMTMADLQALLWYSEKRLYDQAKSRGEVAAGYADDDAPDYRNAVITLARQQGVSEQKIQEALGRETRDRARPAESDTGELGPETPRFSRAQRQESVDQTETPEFRRWFGDSKVVNENGEPLVVYHGSTKAGFTVFDTDGEGKTKGPGAFFTTSPRGASTYSGTTDTVEFFNADEALARPEAFGITVEEEEDGTFTAQDRHGDFEVSGDTREEALELLVDELEFDSRTGRGGNYPVYLKIEDPFIIDAGGANWDSIVDSWALYDEEGELVDWAYTEGEAQVWVEENEGGTYEPDMEKSTDEIVRDARESGADGVIIHNITDEGPFGRGYGWDNSIYVVFDPKQIKSATDNTGAFDPQSPDIRFSRRQVDKMGLYSALGEKVQDGPNRAPWDQWKAYIEGLTKKGVKPSEIEWSGVMDWLALQEGKVTQEQVTGYLANNGVQIQEINLGKQGRPETGGLPATGVLPATVIHMHGVPEADAARAVEGDYTQTMYTEDNGDGTYNVVQDIEDIVDRTVDRDNTRYSSYQLPGGENYREILLTLPAEKPQGELQFGDRVMHGDVEYTLGRNRGGRYLLHKPGQSTYAPLSEITGVTRPIYKSAHWDQPNVLAHIRMNDRTDADGNRVLFIEEIQSDWAQEGRKKGFIRPLNLSSEDVYISDDDGTFHVRKKSDDSVVTIDGIKDFISKSIAEIYTKALDRGVKETKSGVPSAPFVTDTKAWTSLSLKRITALAASEGYDKVAFINGEQSADRYDLSEQVDEIRYEHDEDLGWKLDATKDGKYVPGLGVYKSQGEIADVVGKEVAEKIVKGEGKDVSGEAGVKSLSGVDLKVGGEGMKAFYDNIVPNVLKGVLKKVGGKAETVELDIPGEVSTIPEGMLDEERATPLRGREEGRFAGFSVTPEMREKVVQGQPRFSKRQTETPEFERWFGGSVVTVDGKPGSEPLVVYHGTIADFDTFRRNDEDEGIFFTESPEVASTYASEAGGSGDMASVVPVHITIENPLEITPIEYLNGTTEDGIDLANEKELRDAGYDGIRIASDPNLGFLWSGVTWVAFSPNQIKSATANRGTFDPNNPDIRFSRRSVKPGDTLATAAIKVGGIDVSYRQDILGDTRGNKVLPGVGALFSPRGNSMDDLAVALKDEGYLTPAQLGDLDAREFIYDAIRSELGGRGARHQLNYDPLEGVASPEEEYQRYLDQVDRVPFSRRSVLGNQIASSWSTPEPTMVDDFLHKIQDKQVDTKRVVEAINQQSKQIEDKWDPYLQEGLFHGRAAEGVDRFLDNELKPLMTELQATGETIETMEEYLHNKHARERNAQIEKINPEFEGPGSGITDEDAQAYLDNLPADRKQRLESLAARVRDIVRATQDLLVSSGLETQETVDAWRAVYPDYVPLQREDVDFGMDMTSGAQGTGQGMSVRGGSSQRATGSTRPVTDIFANITMQRERAIVRAEKNRVALALYGLAVQNPNTDFWLPINPDAALTAPGRERLAEELEGVGIHPLDAQNVVEQPVRAYVDRSTGLVQHRVDPTLSGNPNVLSVRINGKDRHLIFNANNERAARMVTSLKNLDASNLGAVMEKVAPITRYFASINTQYNPVFGVTNFARDVQFAALSLSSTELAGEQARLLKNVAPALRGIYGDLRSRRKGKGAQDTEWSRLWEEFKSTGGQTGYREMFKTPADRRKRIEREVKRINSGVVGKGAHAVFDWLSDYNSAMENAVRLSAFKLGIEKGMSKERAAMLAKNLTVNFNRKGDWGRTAGAMWAFFNASVQGTETMIRTLRGPAGRRIIVGGLALGAAQAVLLAMAGFDEDEPPEFVRSRNIIIPWFNEDKDYTTIPMPLGFHVIPNISRILTEAWLSDWEDTPGRVVDLLSVFADSFNPIGSSTLLQTLSPTVTDPIAALSENKDWAGRSIFRERFNARDVSPGTARTKDSASLFSKELAKYLNYSTGGTEFVAGEFSPTPDQIDYLIGYVTGGVGREALKTMGLIESQFTGEELPPYKVPLAGRFYGKATGQSAASAPYYSNLQKMAEYRAEIEGRAETGGDVDAYFEENPSATLAWEAAQSENIVRTLRGALREAVELGATKERVSQLENDITEEMIRFNTMVNEGKDYLRRRKSLNIMGQ